MSGEVTLLNDSPKERSVVRSNMIAVMLFSMSINLPWDDFTCLCRLLINESTPFSTSGSCSLMGKAPKGSKVEAMNFAKQMVGKRLENVVDHKDFMTYMIEYVLYWAAKWTSLMISSSHGVPDGLSRREIERLALSLVIAGSFYHLCGDTRY